MNENWNYRRGDIYLLIGYLLKGEITPMVLKNAFPSAIT